MLSLDEAATLRPQQIIDLSCEFAAVRQQLDWFKRQLFGPDPYGAASLRFRSLAWLVKLGVLKVCA